MGPTRCGGGGEEVRGGDSEEGSRCAAGLVLRLRMDLGVELWLMAWGGGGGADGRILISRSFWRFVLFHLSSLIFDSL